MARCSRPRIWPATSAISTNARKLPKTVLLKPSSESGVKDTQLRWFAGLQVTFGFKGYAELGGKLTLVNAQAHPDDKKGQHEARH